MKKLVVLLLLGISIIAFGEEVKKGNEDIFDLTAIEKQINEVGIPKKSNVQNMKTAADKLFNESKWEEAAVAYEKLAKYSNWLANIIKAGLDPFYSSSYDSKKKIGDSKISELANYERKTNEYIAIRNYAYFQQAKCFLNTGNDNKGISMILKTLDIISVSDTAIWDEARKILYKYIEIE